MKVFVQNWEESERGWGVRPDGATLHRSLQAAKAHVKAYWDRMPDEVPDEYSRPSGEPFEIEVDKDLYKEVPLEGCLHVHRVIREQDKNGFSRWKVVR